MTSMAVRTFLKVAPILPASTSLLLRGNHGIGKSQIVRQLARVVRGQLGLTAAQFPVIDRRLSQVTEGDIIGLPSTDGEVTRFNPPDWFKKACDMPCMLFLDELNRATPEVMQAAFQIVLDRELNGWRLHPETRVCSAINASAAYNVNEVDPALLDRFWVVDINPDLADWLAWAKDPNKDEGGGNIHPTVSDFLSQNEKWLDPPKSSEMGKKETSRRSWERLNDALVAANLIEEPTAELFYPMCLGYIGTEASITFVEFAKTIDNRVTGEEIINDYKKVKPKIDRLGQERMNTAIEKASDYIVKLDKLTEKQGNNLAAFMKDLTGELRISLWTKITLHGIDKLELAKGIHKHCAKEILDVFGVPMGSAGIGVLPNIPGIFKTQSDKK